MTDFHCFTPELIIEATQICDRNCAGCYAANRIMKGHSNLVLFEKYPELFLSKEAMLSTLKTIQRQIGRPIKAISFRGGEPSLHPFLSELLKITQELAEVTYLETHGRWILDCSNQHAVTLLEACARTGVIVKISFDQMHGLKPEELNAMTHTLTHFSIPWVIAITEKNSEETLRTLNLISWVTRDRIVLQKKAITLDQLYRPALGVIQVNGNLVQALNVKNSFKNPPKIEKEVVQWQ